jgi:hypothetical protein
MIPLAAFALMATAFLLQSRNAYAEDVFAIVTFTNDTADPITITSGKFNGTAWHDPGPMGGGIVNVANPVQLVVSPNETLAFGTYEHNSPPPFFGTNGTGGDVTFNKPDGTVVTLTWSSPFPAASPGCGSDIGYKGPSGNTFNVGAPVDVAGGPVSAGSDSCTFSFGATEPAGTLASGRGLFKGYSAQSSDGRFKLTMQGDGNLVIYYGSVPLWATGTSGSAAAVAAMETNGDLVLYDTSMNKVWGADSAPGFVFTTGAALTIQNDGNVVIYRGDPSLRGQTNWMGRRDFVFWGQNVNYNTQPTNGQDWAVGDFKGQCPAGQAIVGISEDTSEDNAVGVLCGVGTSSNNFPMTSCRGLTFDPTNNESDTADGDWDFGFAKAECAASEFVGGIAQSSVGSVDGVLCCTGSVTHSNCTTELIYDINSADYSPPDWDPGDFKGQCPAGKYVAGISAGVSTTQSTTIGAPDRLLCCSP